MNMLSDPAAVQMFCNKHLWNKKKQDWVKCKLKQIRETKVFVLNLESTNPCVILLPYILMILP